ncbi:MAG: arsenate reductase (glutaredoxin) [Gammaproteobacteria bacterium]|nr:arsenate reductase (glutaredoxin) [Gammaproteobacteria bacterium]NND53667.1 arsenate reductase (glutaredoxin) [Gammaproteobacteria bacterium]
MPVTLYHNPRCSKSRATLALLEDRGIAPDVIEYLKTPPNAATLATVIDKLGIDATHLMRTGEAEYQAAKDELDTMNEPERIAWLCANPRVIERPIVVTDHAARIGRPPEAVLEIL